MAGTLSGGQNTWRITGEDRAKHDEQFFILKPVNGFITGEQARNFFLQSNLSQQVLSHIWSLADMNNDGKMDKHEFSIAMHLIQKKLQGFELPKTLPPSLKSHPTPTLGTFGNPAMGIGTLIQPIGTQGMQQINTSATFAPGAFSTPAPRPLLTNGSIMMGQGMMGGSASLPPMGTTSGFIVNNKTRSGSITSLDGSRSSPLSVDWTIPHQSKLKYNQMFNTQDRSRTGFLTGVQARGILVHSGLPQSILAQIWALADIDNDGRLTSEEFCIALHLVDMVKAGETLPPTLPPELVPPVYRRRRSSSLQGVQQTMGSISIPPPVSAPMSQSSMISSMGIPMGMTMQPSMGTVPLTSLPPVIPRQDLLGDLGGLGSLSDGAISEDDKPKMIATFEDRRKENFDKGQAELERRRLALLEMQRKEQEERERKEREEQEKRERIRQEQERRKQMEVEKHLAKQREIEQEKEEQRRKALEQREAARREMERQRQLEWERNRRQELMSQRQKEQEQVCHLKQKNKNLAYDLEQLDDKINQLNTKIHNARNGLGEVKSSIDNMRLSRDAKLGEIEKIQTALQVENQNFLQLGIKKQVLMEKQMQSVIINPVAESYKIVMHSYNNKQIALNQLKKTLEQMENETSRKIEELDKKNAELNSFKQSLTQLVHEGNKLQKLYQEKRKEILMLKRPREEPLQIKPQSPPQPQTKLIQEPSLHISENDWTQKADDWAQKTNDWATKTDDWAENRNNFFWSQEDSGTKENLELVPNVSIAEPKMTKYRALYAFDARNPDELSIMPGDIIMVPENQNAEPGWLGGELKGQTGWFPEAYVEKVEEYSLTEIIQEDRTESPSTIATNARETVHIVGTEMKMTLTEISEAPENSIDTTPVESTTQENLSTAQSSFMQIPKTFAGTSSPTPGQGQLAPEGLLAQALYPWKAKKDNHLTFIKGDIIQVKEQQDSWWYGEYDGKLGWFPKSYVKLIAGPRKMADSSRSQTPISDKESVSGSMTGSTHSSPSLERKSEKSPNGDLHVAMYNYISAEIGDLSFNQGDIITVTKSEGDWWMGTLGDKTGVFPANYVRKMETPELELVKSAKSTKKPEIASVIAPYAATGPEQLSLMPGQLIQVRKKAPSGWWEGELQARGKKRQIGWFPANYVKLLGNNAAERNSISDLALESPQSDLNGSSQSTTTGEQVVALYNYTAQSDDELTFSKDSIITLISKDDNDWWKGEFNGVQGMFPANYVQILSYTHQDTASSVVPQWRNNTQMSTIERKRQGAIQELIATEESYMTDMSFVLDVFCKPLTDAKVFTPEEAQKVFVNWNELIMCNNKLVKAFRVRRKMSDGKVINIIGDILMENLPHMSPYIRFCSCQLNAGIIIQHKTENNPEFKAIARKCCQDPRTKGMPLSSFLLKPMQRITRYPLIIKKILEYTPIDHPDHENLQEALTKAEELCTQVNEGVREKENSDRLEWLQTHIHCDAILEAITFNSMTNCLGPRKFIHSGTLFKAKSNKELVSFLFNDFLLLTQPIRPLGSVVSVFQFDKNTSIQYKMYKTPIFLNEIIIKPQDPSEDLTVFHIQHIDRTISLKAISIPDRAVWVKKIELASKQYIETEFKRRERAHSLRYHVPMGKLRLTVVEGQHLMCNPTKGRSDPYCEVSMGSQEHKTKVVNGTVNPKWNSSMQFIIKDLEEDVLCITVFDRDYFSPNDFLGRTEIRIYDIYNETKKNKGPIIKRLLLHEVDSGEVLLKLDLQIFEKTNS